MVHRQSQVTDRGLNRSRSQDEEFKQLGTETVVRAFELLESSAWKVEKKLTGDDVIYTTNKAIGKVYKLRGRVNYPPKKLLHELYYNIEEVPSWNPTLLESRVIKVSWKSLKVFTSWLSEWYCETFVIEKLFKISTNCKFWKFWVQCTFVFKNIESRILKIFWNYFYDRSVSKHSKFTSRSTLCVQFKYYFQLKSLIY